MQERKIFFTGYPGFIGRWQVRSILEDDPGAEITCLVQEKFMARAKEDIARMETEGVARSGSLTAVSGDVTDPQLGLSPERYGALAAQTREVWNLAGAFDLDVPEGLARRINYWGTKHVLDFCRRCADLSHLVHFSSVVVHAEREGIITEDELDAGQELINNYFATKFWGEVAVRWAMEEGLPAIIIRPAGVMGDSRTGETDKFDNVYLAFRLCHRIASSRFLKPVYLGKGEARPNFIPVDYLVSAATAIARNPEAIGKCFHVVDPDPPTSREMTALIWDLVGGIRPTITVPTALADLVAKRFPWIYRLLGMPPVSMTYMNHVGFFDDANTRAALQGTGISCPRMTDYLPVLYRWWLANRDREGMTPKM